jgi:formate hydrogenlyase transcriptional activator
VSDSAASKEAERLVVVRRYTGLLAGFSKGDLQDVVELSAQVCASPYAAVSLVDSETMSLGAAIGPLPRSVPRAGSFCAEAIRIGATLIVPDAAADARFASSPLVVDQPSVRFYAGLPLSISPNGTRIGTLSVMDSKPRLGGLTADQLHALGILARQAAAAFELIGLRAGDELKTRIIETSRDCVKVLDLDANLLSMNAGGVAALEIPDLNAVLGSCWLDFWTGTDRQAALAALEVARQGGVGRFVGFFPTVANRQPRWWHVVVSAIAGPDGRPERLLAVSRDVSDWKEAELSRERAEARKRAILEVNNAIISNLTQDSLLQAISAALFKVVPFDRAALTLHDADVDRMRVLALAGRLPPSSYPVGVVLDRKDSHVGWAFDHQRTLLRRDLEKEKQFTPERRLYDEGIRSLCTAPLVLGGKSIGTVTLGSTTPNQFTEADETFLAEVSSQIALAVSNMRAYEEIEALKARLEAENVYLQEEIRVEHNYSEIVGTSTAIREVLRNVEQVAATDSTVLVIGETGTGKELIARAIHDRSGRKDRPLVKVNCGAISAGLVESELFGHVKGAFTGALANRDGRFKLADGGTIFLDEISELPLESQVKLLRVLQEQEFEPVGSSKSIKVDVRVIAATNRDLGATVTAGKFRGDLFYRLNVVPIRVPPLREREGDIDLLVKFFVQKFAQKLGRAGSAVQTAAMQRLRAYDWPGNIRELQNVIERAVVLSQGGVLALGGEFGTLPSVGSKAKAAAVVARASVSAPASEAVAPSRASLQDVERQHIEAVLIDRNWLIEGDRGAAKVLNLHPNTLRGRMRKLGLKRPTESS